MSETSKPFNPNLRTAIDTDVRPGTPAPAPAGEGHAPNPNKKKKTGLVVGAVAGIAGLALAGSAAILGPRLLNGNGDNDPNLGNGPVPAATDDPGQGNGEGEQPAGDVLPTVEQVEIQSGLSAQEVGELIVNSRINNWIHSGITDDSMNRWDYHTGDDAAFINDIVYKYAPVYKSALFTPDVEMNNVDLTVTHSYYLEAVFKTGNTDYDAQRYQGAFTVDGEVRTISEGDGVRVIEVDYTYNGNSDQNRVGEDFSTSLASGEGKANTLTLTLVTQDDGTEKISSIQAASR